MSDKELADKVVALGVECGDARLFMNGQILYHEFLTDWRVAGALMEKLDSVYVDKMVDGDWSVEASTDCIPHKVRNGSLPRAIVEACAEALEQSDG